MKSILSLISGLLILAIVGTGSLSCRKASCGSLGWAVDIQDELNNLSATSAAYSQNPTPANCQAYREAYIDYIDALKSWDKCVESGSRASWQQSLNEAEQDAENLQC